jgi:hypothetical protein
MSLQIVTRICLKHAGREVVVPESLIVDKLGVKYLKVITSCQPLIRAIFPDRDIPHNASIAASSVIQRLAHERNVKCGLKASDALADELFDGGVELETPPKKKKKLHDRKLIKDPFILSTDGIHIMATKDVKAALHIRLETNDLATLFDALNKMEDKDQCLVGGNKRNYVKSGKYKNKEPEMDTHEDAEVDA